MPAVLDACTLIAYLRREPGWIAVRELLSEGRTNSFIHAVNLVEVRYDMARVEGRERADIFIADLVQAGMTLSRDLDDEFCDVVAGLKSRGRISLADCFCIALANRLGGEVWTADRAEFQPMHDAGACRAVFIR